MTATTLPATSALPMAPMVNASPTDTPTETPSARSSAETLCAEPSAKRHAWTPFHKKALAHDETPGVVERSASPKRSRTFWAAFRSLYHLTEQQVADFMASYAIYNLDWADTDAMRAALGDDYQQKVGDCLRAYYGVMNHLCALGDVEKMYIPPLMDARASVRDNQLLYEESVARDLGLQPGMRVLDIGCGRGRVAAHMARFAGVRVTGLNIDPDQVAQARAFNAAQKLDNEFVEWDQNTLPLPFADGTFDGAYQIQAFSLCRDLPAMFAELRRVLKPGARFSMLDWVALPAYDAANPAHAQLMRRVKPLIGAVGTPTPASLERDMQSAGLRVLVSDNASVGGLQAPLIDRVDVYFRGVRQLILALVRVHALPKHFRTLINRLCLDGQAFVEMDRRRLVTTSYRLIASTPQ